MDGAGADHDQEPLIAAMEDGVDGVARAITTRVAVSVRGISRITCSGVLSSLSSRMRRSSVVLNMAKFLLVLRTCRPNKKPPGLAACSEFGLQLLLLECARSSHRQRAVVAKVPKIAGGAVDHGQPHSLAARPCHPPITRSYS